jgi:dGTPase
MNEEIMNNMNKDNSLSLYACKNADAIRLYNEQSDYRPPFFRDVDRIIYSLSYTRYMDKTQVFSRIVNDHISKRMTHVQMVSKIARTIGRALALNEDLIEAIALGHDIGHTPLGHVGESMLNEI